jgi:hypothetical protein
MQRDPRRWRGNFTSFVGSCTVAAFIHELGAAGEPIGKEAVYSWIAGRTAPRARVAAAIVRISDGKLTLDDLYGHRHEVRGGDGGRRRARGVAGG